jgi:hypothetical protein
MADDENQEEVEQPKQVEESGGVLDLNSALQQVLKKAAVQPDGLARGLREAVKALDRKVVSSRSCPVCTPASCHSCEGKGGSRFNVEIKSQRIMRGLVPRGLDKTWVNTILVLSSVGDPSDGATLGARDASLRLATASAARP